MTRGGDGVGSDFMKHRNRTKMQDGSHNFANGGLAKLNQERIAAGTHHLSGEQGSKFQLDRMSTGKHNWANGQLSALQRKRVNDGTHNMLKGSTEIQRRHDAGVYEFVALQRSKAHQRTLADGTSKLLIEYTCPHCGKQGNGPVMTRWHFDNCKLK
jgi:hypothetical protein